MRLLVQLGPAPWSLTQVGADLAEAIWISSLLEVPSWDGARLALFTFVITQLGLELGSALCYCAQHTILLTMPGHLLSCWFRSSRLTTTQKTPMIFMQTSRCTHHTFWFPWNCAVFRGKGFIKSIPDSPSFPVTCFTLLEDYEEYLLQNTFLLWAAAQHSAEFRGSANTTDALWP